MTYALVQDGTVVRTGAIPRTWRLADRRWVSGFDLLPALWASEGWLPIVEVRPELGADEQYGAPTYTVGAAEVTATYPAEPIPPPPPDAPEVVVARLVATERILAGSFDDTTVAAVSTLFAPWKAGQSVRVGDLRSWDGTVVECVQAHKTQADWTPNVVPALWKIHRSSSSIDPWVQPQGAHDAYQLGDRVTHKGQTWESKYANNVWEPGVFGWVVV